MAERIGIIGAGAIGGVVGGLLTRAGYDVTLIDHWVDHVEAMKQNGLRLSGPLIGDIRVPVNALHLHEVQAIEEPFDLGFVSVKSYDTEWATSFISPLVRDEGAIVDFQNGINDERVAAIAGRDRTLGCVITIGCGMYEPGHCMRTDTRTQGFKVGELDGVKSDRAARIASIHQSRRGRGSDRQSVGRALGQAGGQLHGQRGGRTLRLRLGRGAGARRHALALHPHRRRGDRGRPRARPRNRRRLGYRCATLRRCRQRQRFHTARCRADRRRPGPRRRPPLAAARRDPRPPSRNRRPQRLGRRPRPGRRSPHPSERRDHPRSSAASPSARSAPTPQISKQSWRGSTSIKLRPAGAVCRAGRSGSAFRC